MMRKEIIFIVSADSTLRISDNVPHCSLRRFSVIMVPFTLNGNLQGAIRMYLQYYAIIHLMT